MRILALLSSLDDETLERLAQQHLGTDEEPRASRCVSLESELRSPRHIRDTIYNLQPPAFRILEALLDSEDHSIPLAGLRERSTDDTASLAALVSANTICYHREGLKLYRKMLAEARRIDSLIEPNEGALLAVLRRELGIFQVEHFLTEHHTDLQSFWNDESAFLRVMEKMRIGGLAFAVEGRLVLPDDFVALVRQVLGLEISSAARRRLLGRLSGQETGEMLQTLGLKSAGSKEEKLQRLFENFVPPSEYLPVLGIGRLKDLCKELEIQSSGSKDELVNRIIAHFAANRDIMPPLAPEPPPPPEPRRLTPEKFDALFQSLRQQDLSDILAAIGSNRVTGSKEQLLKLVKESPFAETTLLMELGIKQLEAALSRSMLKTGGTKTDKVGRLLAAVEQAGEKLFEGPAAESAP